MIIRDYYKEWVELGLDLQYETILDEVCINSKYVISLRKFQEVVNFRLSTKWTEDFKEEEDEFWGFCDSFITDLMKLGVL